MIPLNENMMSAYILAGGKSTRMGQDKGLMIFQNQSIIERILDRLSLVFADIVIVSNNDEYRKFGCQVIPDQFVNIGPAGGIHAVLKQSKTHSNFIISCDMPFVTKDGIQFMLSQAENYDITVPKQGENIEPLFGIYSSECENKWNNLIMSSKFKLQDMMSHFNTNYVNVDSLTEFQSPFFMNINTMNDFNNALSLVKHDN